MVLIEANQTHSLGCTVRLEFNISQHSRDEQLMKSLINYFQCGYIYKDKTRPNLVNFIVRKFKDVAEKIIPFFQAEKRQFRGLRLRILQISALFSSLLFETKEENELVFPL